MGNFISIIGTVNRKANPIEYKNFSINTEYIICIYDRKDENKNWTVIHTTDTDYYLEDNIESLLKVINDVSLNSEG